jgi:hypothetical protein
VLTFNEILHTSDLNVFKFSIENAILLNALSLSLTLKKMQNLLFCIFLSHIRIDFEGSCKVQVVNLPKKGYYKKSFRSCLL